NGDTTAHEHPFVLATSGGGVDGPALLETFVRAAASLQAERGGTWLAVAGPLMSDEDHARIVSLAEADNIAVRRVVPELRNTIATADCVVSMAGYNTVCDIMSYHRSSVLVPRSHPSREQSLRAERLEEWGVADVVRAEELSPRSLAHAIEHALAKPGPSPGQVPLGGLESALDVFDGVCAEVGARAGRHGRGPHTDEPISPELVLVSLKTALGEHERRTALTDHDRRPRASDCGKR